MTAKIPDSIKFRREMKFNGNQLENHSAVLPSPDLSKPNEWFYYDEGFVKCYEVNPYTGEKEG